jgi:hypothetical protein
MRSLLVMLTGIVLCAGCQQKTAAPPAPPPLMPISAPAPVAETATTNAPVAEETVKAGVGVGKQGRSLDEHEGMVVTPVKSLFAAKEMIAYEIIVPQMLALFQATEGRHPKSHEEFWEKIIVANNLEPKPGTDNKNRLPELPEGHKYFYDAEKHELMVQRPAK